MKNFSQYIKEALRPEVTKWIKSIYDKMVDLVKEKKLNGNLEVDIKKLAKPEKGGFEYDDFISDKLVRTFLDNNIFGFTVINQMIQNPKKYLMSTGEIEEEIKPECLPYWFQGENDVYFVGLVMFDTNVTYKDESVNLVAIETSLCVDKSLPLLKAILTDFSLHYLNKKGNYKYLASKPSHPKMEAILKKLGFRPDTENKEILTYKI